MHDKILGMMFGVGVGDSLGSPVECWTQSKILEKYPEGIQDYEEGRKPKGAVTDDTMLSMATMEGLILGKGYDLDSVADCHVVYYEEDEDAGYGASTKESIRRIANGVSWKESGIPDNTKKVYGLGNGLPMKVAPIAGLFLKQVNNDFVINFSAMTHYTKMSAYAALVHTHVLYNLLDGNDDIISVIAEVKTWCDENPQKFDYLADTEDCLWERFDQLNSSMSFEEIADTFKGTYYVYDSLPYVYAHWLKNHANVNCMFDCINYCGEYRSDTDSNASMLGGMLGAYYGEGVFSIELIKGLSVADRIEDLVNDFYHMMRHNYVRF